MDPKILLLPVDGSEHAANAVDTAIDIAGRHAAHVILLHCRKALPLYLGEPYFQAVHDQVMRHTEELMEPYRQRLVDSGVDFSERLLEGRPAEAICQAAVVEKCDLIVMGSRGVTDLAGLLLGSVTHRVLHGTPCPVLVIP